MSWATSVASARERARPAGSATDEPAAAVSRSPCSPSPAATVWSQPHEPGTWASASPHTTAYAAAVEVGEQRLVPRPPPETDSQRSSWRAARSPACSRAVVAAPDWLRQTTATDPVGATTPLPPRSP